MIPEGQIETGCLGTCETSCVRGNSFLVDLTVFVEVFRCMLTFEPCVMLRVEHGADCSYLVFLGFGGHERTSVTVEGNAL